MLITLRLPRHSALKLNVPVGDVEAHEVMTTLTAVELAGRVSLTTGKAISPEAVVRYCVAWQRATTMLHKITADHGEVTLAELVREACARRLLWVPLHRKSILEWLQCVLEVSFLLSEETTPTVSDGIGPGTAEDIAASLARLCLRSFPQAYALWVIEEAWAAPGK